VQVNGNGYKLLGFVVWRGARWYARRKLPSARATAAGALGALAALGVVALIARRARADPGMIAMPRAVRLSA
jgi:hypothetical protein